jgi:hypothetical protein
MVRRVVIGGVAAAAVLFGAPLANAASLFDPVTVCLHGAPAGWITAPAKAGDQFTVWAPPGHGARAADAASEIRSKGFFGFYEGKLQIPRLGFPGQTGRLDVFLDPELGVAYKNANGVNEPRCENAAVDAVDINAVISNAEEFHAAIAHELFHAAQAQLAGDYSNNWWYEATATWAVTNFGFDKPVPDGFSKSVTNVPLTPMDHFSQDVDGTDAHEYGAWTFVAWLMSRHKLSWTQLKNSFSSAAHSDATPIIDQALAASKSSLGDEVASYWADHLNKKPSFGPTAHMTPIKVSTKTDQFAIPTADYLGSATLAVKPSSDKQQMALIVKKPPQGVQVWIKVGDSNKDLLRVPAGESFNETFCRKGATAGSYDLPKSGDVRVAITTTEKGNPPPVHFKVITSTEPCPKKILVIPGIAIGTLHLGMTVAEAQAAAPRNHIFPAHVPTPVGIWQTSAFNVDNGLVVGEFLDGRIAALFTSNFRARTTTGLRNSEIQLPHFIPGTDDYDRPILLPGSTISEFGPGHCAPVPSKNEPSEYCWHQDPPTRYTLAISVQIDPCPVDAGEKSPDQDVDVPVCEYPKDFYVTGLAVATSRGEKLLRGLVTMLASNP